jgi:hypothetical protein
MALVLTTPAPDANDTIAVGGATMSGDVNVMNSTSSVVLTGTKTAAQTVVVGGANAGLVTAAGTATAPTYTVDTSSISATGGSVSFTLTVAQPGYSSIVYTVDVIVPISNLASTGQTNTTATFSFTAPTGATAVVLEQATDIGGTWVWVPATTGTLSASSTTATATGLTESLPYEFELVVTDGSYAGTSNVVDVTPVAEVDLGLAAQYGVLAYSGITGTLNSTNGDYGTSTASDSGAFPLGAGTPDETDVSTAQGNLGTAIANASTPVPDAISLTGGEDIGGLILTPGVYHSGSSIGIGTTTGATGSKLTLTLDAQGDPNAVFIFQMPSSTLKTGVGSSVILIHGAKASNVFWQVGSSATLGTNSAFEGNILATVSITATTGDTVTGRLLANTGAVVLAGNPITLP